MKTKDVSKSYGQVIFTSILAAITAIAAALIAFLLGAGFAWLTGILAAAAAVAVLWALLGVYDTKRSAKMLEEECRRYQRVFSDCPMGMAQAVRVTGAEYRLIETNAKFRQYFGIIPRDYEGVSLSNSSNEMLRLMNAWIDAFNTNMANDGSQVQTFEITLENIDKTFNTTIFVDEQNHINLVVLDVTEQKEAEAKLSKAIEETNVAYKTQGEFLANMSHEIRTPINGILGMLQLTLISNDLTTENRDNLETAKNCADTLLRLINDILDYTKLEAGKYKIRYTEMDIKEVIENTVNLQRPIADNKNLLLDCQIGANAPKTLIGDPQRVEQVLNCILSNAIKFTTNGGVRVKVAFIEETPTQVRVRIAVADSGIGISDQDKEKLFKRFSQVDSSNTRKFGGTGLGLVITKQIVELMNGTIQVQSKEGIGSTFIIELPMEVVVKEEVAEEMTDASIFSMESSSRVHVLVAEDEPVNQQVIGKLLGMAGYSYDIAGNGQAAVDLFKERHYDVGLFDVQMPVMDGLEATKLIREIEVQRGTGEHLPIIAVTARAMFGEKEKILEAKLDDYVAKPYVLEDIVAAINKYTGK
ncbi:MAG: ATP-binding protein [Lachnospiraceae bacterium]|nr:ATP-binding protein [Lachnospiraceae bacterium]